jgi:hypothetical protein
MSNALSAAAATGRPSEWAVLTNNGTTITAKNRVTGEEFSGTQAQLNSKLTSTQVSELGGLITGATDPVNADGMPDGTLYLKVEP